MFANVSKTITQQYQDAIPLNKCPEIIPGKPHCATVWRWATKGVRGIRLATVIVGGRRMVTLQALEQFLAALNTDSPALQSDRDSETARRAKEAGDALEKLGC